jgi:hypothetical protein
VRAQRWAQVGATALQSLHALHEDGDDDMLWLEPLGECRALRDFDPALRAPAETALRQWARGGAVSDAVLAAESDGVLVVSLASALALVAG